MKIVSFDSNIMYNNFFELENPTLYKVKNGSEFSFYILPIINYSIKINGVLFKNLSSNLIILNPQETFSIIKLSKLDISIYNFSYL